MFRYEQKAKNLFPVRYIKNDSTVMLFWYFTIRSEYDMLNATSNKYFFIDIGGTILWHVLPFPAICIMTKEPWKR